MWIFFFKQKTAYEMRISDWSSDVCSSDLAGESGGLSGAPLKGRALEMLRQFRRATGGALPLIGVGGIGSAEDAYERIRAGASLVQLYTALVYEGPGLVRDRKSTRLNSSH